MWSVDLRSQEAVPAATPSRFTSEMILDRQARAVGRLKSAEAAATGSSRSVNRFRAVDLKHHLYAHEPPIHPPNSSAHDCPCCEYQGVCESCSGRFENRQAPLLTMSRTAPQQESKQQACTMQLRAKFDSQCAAVRDRPEALTLHSSAAGPVGPRTRRRIRAEARHYAVHGLDPTLEWRMG